MTDEVRLGYKVIGIKRRRLPRSTLWRIPREELPRRLSDGSARICLKGQLQFDDRRLLFSQAEIRLREV